MRHRVGMEFGERCEEGSVRPLPSLLQLFGGGWGGMGLVGCLVGLGWMGLLLVCDCGTEKAVSILGLYCNAFTPA